jgi:Tol biopolymer transport system component
MKRLFFVVLNLLLLAAISKSQDISYDISADDEHILFSRVDNGSSIYISNIDGTHSRKIIASTIDTSYYNPKYSPDGKKIVFIKNKRGSLNGSICVSDVKGLNIRQLTDNEHIVTEAIFSHNSDRIYFCMANVYRKYSPIGVAAPHDFDIYSIIIKTGNIEKISNLKLYSLHGISELDSINILMSSYTPEGSMFIFSKKDGKLNNLLPSNEPEEYKMPADIYSSPVYSKYTKLLAFTATLRLYVMGSMDKIAKRIFCNDHGSQLLQICPFKKTNRLMFSILHDSNLYSINVDGSDIKKISLNIN